MVLKIWRGDAIAVAQQTRITPAAVEVGDVFTITINGKSVSVVATAATVANVCTLLTAAMAANRSAIPEFTEFTVTNQTTSVLLTANAAGVPFVVTASASNGSVLGVTIATVRDGSATGSVVNMTQTFRVPLSASGTFVVAIGGQYSSALAVGASAATVQTAVQALSTIGSGNCSVAKSSDSNDDIFTLTINGALAGTNIATAVVTVTSSKPIIRTTQQGSSSGTIQNEIQTIDTGSLTGGGGAPTAFGIVFNGQSTGAGSLYPETTAAGLDGQLEALSNLSSLTVTKAGQVFTVEFTGADGSANQPQMTALNYSSTTSDHSVTVTTTPASGSGSSVNEQQTVTLTGSPTGGTFTLTFNGQTTSAIAYNATAATVQTALRALSSITGTNANVAGSAGGPYTVDFVGTLAALNQPEMTGNGGSLTGGSGQTLTVTDIISSAGPNHWDTAGNWLPAGVPATGDDVRFEIGNVSCLYGLAQSGVTLASLNVAMSYTGKIGLPRVNSLGFLEYRTQELTIGATLILIGYGAGSGPSKIGLNSGSVRSSLEIRDSGGSSESGVPAVTWRGTNTLNVLEMYGGDVGVALYSDQAATIDKLIQRGGSLNARHTDFLTSALFVSALFYDCRLNGKSLESY